MEQLKKIFRDLFVSTASDSARANRLATVARAVVKNPKLRATVLTSDSQASRDAIVIALVGQSI